MIKQSICCGSILLAVLATPVTYGEESKSAHSSLAYFSASWDESAWTGGRRAYIRPLDDDDWKLRMHTLQGLSQLGASAEDALLKTLKDGDAPERILAAQALGYLGSDVPVQRLLDLLKEERHSSVRLYLVDAIGMMGKGDEAASSLRQWRTQEPNGDVKKHIGYALDRGAKKIDPHVLQTLRDYDERKIATAQRGKQAPDFRLKTVDGDEIQLSQFRGKQTIVLVFVYGDT